MFEITEFTPLHQQNLISFLHFTQSHFLANKRWSDLVTRTKAASHIHEISAAELNNHIQGQSPSSSETAPVIIDVREGSELELGKIPHAISVPRGVLELRIEKIVNTDSNRPIILYCAGGLRSVMAAEALQRMGYDNEKIKSLNGGFEQWREEGYDIEC
ncbi:hypothetical protein INT44_005602 [Umbelopsis vinacea]|uniref:Rhodanese domain-containing protein n=1 Tax=Umbelopsis vinacea TaxID=44442 RepID=A0A8H7PZH2_9FUNG|nr:hypothetical protein INT44_005602 [Umbelopsis vinacea]